MKENAVQFFVVLSIVIFMFSTAKDNFSVHLSADVKTKQKNTQRNPSSLFFPSPFLFFFLFCICVWIFFKFF